jgi:putative MATE family efflux protein
MNRYFKPMIQLSWPIMVGMILQSMLGTVDLYFVAKLGTKPTAALAIGANVFIVINAFSAIVSTGILAITARRKGEGNLEEARKLTVVGARLALFIGLLILVFGYGQMKQSIKLMFNTRPETTVLIVEYLQIILMFTPLVFLSSSLRSSLHALGDTRTPLMIFGFSNIINMILDPIFIFKLGLGIRGAALATGISISVATILIFRAAIIKQYLGQKRLLLNEMLQFDYYRSVGILRIGIWDAIQQVARPLTAILMFRIVYQVGRDSGTAAFGIGGQFVSYTFIFLTGLTIAVSVMVGQKLGEGKVDEVDQIIRFAFKLSFVNMLLFALPYLIFSENIMRFFTDQASVIKHGIAYLRIVYVGILFVVVPIVYGGALKGAGYTYGPMIASLLANVFVKVGFAYLLSIRLEVGVRGVWWAISISVIVEAVMIIIMEKRRDWKYIKI